MGLYDSVIVTCRECCKDLELKSKSGPCNLNVYHCLDVPSEVFEGLDPKVKCNDCLSKFKIREYDVSGFVNKRSFYLIKYSEDNYDEDIIGFVEY